LHKLSLTSSVRLTPELAQADGIATRRPGAAGLQFDSSDVHIEAEEEFLRKTDEFLINNTFLKKGHKIIITGGMPCMAVGTTNFIRIHEVGEVL